MAVLAVTTGLALARYNEQITGSSTVLSYATIVAEAFGDSFEFPIPVVETSRGGRCSSLTATVRIIAWVFWNCWAVRCGGTVSLLSQVLSCLESNTRTATVVGAIVGGGIGLMLMQAIQTQKDWEEVAYYMILVVPMVMAMDGLSGWLRRKPIKGE